LKAIGVNHATIEAKMMKVKLCLGYKKGAKTEAKRSSENANISKSLTSTRAYRIIALKVHTPNPKIGRPKLSCIMDGIKEPNIMLRLANTI